MDRVVPSLATPTPNRSTAELRNDWPRLELYALSAEQFTTRGRLFLNAYPVLYPQYARGSHAISACNFAGQSGVVRDCLPLRERKAQRQPVGSLSL